MSDKNLDIEKVLDILGNETRRRILRYLAEEPRYFIQLSKELGVSQQAVLKHLEILHALNLVESFAEKSDLAGPDRKYYRLNRSLILTIGLFFQLKYKGGITKFYAGISILIYLMFLYFNFQYGLDIEL